MVVLIKKTLNEQIYVLLSVDSQLLLQYLYICIFLKIYLLNCIQTLCHVVITNSYFPSSKTCIVLLIQSIQNLCPSYIRLVQNGLSKSEKWFCPKFENFHIFSSLVAGKCARINMNPSLFQNFDSRPIGLRCVVQYYSIVSKTALRHIFEKSY